MGVTALDPPLDNVSSLPGQLPESTIWSYRRGVDVLDIKVGYLCNDNCVHCVVDPVRRRLNDFNERGNLTTAEVERQIDDAARMNAQSVVLTGGEVTIRSDFHHLVDYASALGLKVIIQTNGRMLSDRKRSDRLLPYMNMLFVVALHGPRAETHDRITRHAGSFEQTCSAITNLRAMNKEVAVKMVLSNYNSGEVLATARLARQLDANELCITFPHALDFTPDQFESVVPKYEAIRDEVRAVSLYVEAEGLRATFETIPFCIVPDLPAFWKRSCDLQAAFDAPRKHVAPPADGRFDWERLRPTMKEKSESCRTCVFDPLCEGPWREYVEAHGFAEFRPVGCAEVLEFISMAGENAAVTCTAGAGAKLDLPPRAER